MQGRIISLIQEYVQGYPELKRTSPRWRAPLVGFAAARDPDFFRLKEAVSPTHALPEDLLAGARSVIAYFLPFVPEISRSNIPGREASRLWVETYVETNRLIGDINRHLQAYLAGEGYDSALVPATHNFDEAKLISDWSHRHVAVIAGLGGFGHNNMLITDHGCCGRVGSLVTNLEIPPSPREGREYCLARYDGSCRKCVGRCVNEALLDHSFDRWKCYEMCRHNEGLFPDLGVADVCGKCLVGLPCSATNPVGHKVRSQKEEGGKS